MTNTFTLTGKLLDKHKQPIVGLRVVLNGAPWVTSDGTVDEVYLRAPDVETDEYGRLRVVGSTVTGVTLITGVQYTLRTVPSELNNLVFDAPAAGTSLDIADIIGLAPPTPRPEAIYTILLSYDTRLDALEAGETGGGVGAVRAVNNRTPDGDGFLTLTAADVGAETPTGAQAKANSAQAGAINLAALDATSKANAAQAGAVSAAAADATTKANAAQAAATTSAAADAAAKVLVERNRALGVEAVKADLVNGKIPANQIPASSVFEVFTVNSQAAMLALAAQMYDVAVRSDFTPRRRFELLGNGDPTVLANWSVISVDPNANVDSVNGYNGAVTLGPGDVGATPAAHATDQTNPHGVTKGQVGLGNVDNTSDVNKPVSTAQANADSAVQTAAATDATTKANAARDAARATSLQKDQNLADLAAPATARTNLGLKGLAVKDKATVPTDLATTGTPSGTTYLDGTGAWSTPPPAVYSSPMAYSQPSVQAGDTIDAATAGTTETAFASRYTIPANSLSVGDRIVLEASGTFTTSATAPPTQQPRVRLGTAVGVDAGAVTVGLVGTAFTNVRFRGAASFIVRAIGASGSIECVGDFDFFSNTMTDPTYRSLIGRSGTSQATMPVLTIDTTVAIPVTLSTQFSAGTAGNSVTLRQLSIDLRKSATVVPAGVSSATPAALDGSAAAGTDAQASRSDHKHAITVLTQGLTVSSATSSGVALIVKGLASQLADLQQWQNSSSSPLLKVTASGYLETPAAELRLLQTGGPLGASYLKIQNAGGGAGGIFGCETLDLVDLGFLPSSGAQGNFRWEHRSGQVTAGNETGEFQFVDTGAGVTLARLGRGASSFSSITTFPGLRIFNSSIEFLTGGDGLFLRSPNNTRYKVTVANGGALTTTAA